MVYRTPLLTCPHISLKGPNLSFPVRRISLLKLNLNRFNPDFFLLSRNLNLILILPSVLASWVVGPLRPFHLSSHGLINSPLYPCELDGGAPAPLPSELARSYLIS